VLFVEATRIYNNFGQVAPLPAGCGSVVLNFPTDASKLTPFKKHQNDWDRGMLPTGMTRFWIICILSLIGGLFHVRLCLAGLRPAERVTPIRSDANAVDFERHIVGLFGRMGCNSGSCHGSFQGRGGFRLSLFGYDADMDYRAVTHDVLGRRINRVEPDRSLILLKPTGQIEHGGGKRFSRESWQYQLLREWVRRGARWTKGSGEIAAILVSPGEQRLDRSGDSIQLSVRARFADRSEEDVTRFCEFRSNDDSIALVNPSGLVKAGRPGDTAVIVTYRGYVATARVLIPAEIAPGHGYPKLRAGNFIDRAVFVKLRSLNIVPSNLADDAEFLRRVTIDTIGSLPSPGEVRAFLADPSPDKRVRKIDELLCHPLHAALWATKLCDITGNNTDTLELPRDMQAKRSQMWHDWFRKRIAENVPYDVMVHGVLCATSREGLLPENWLKQVKDLEEEARKGFATSYASRESLDLFWRKQINVPVEQWGEKTAAAFMGIRLECAQCHKHPYDRWTQADYRSFANVFTQVSFGTSPEAKKIIDDENAERKKQTTANKKMQLAQVREIFIAGKSKLLADPESKKPLPAKILGGPIIKIEPEKDARKLLFNWLRSPNNNYLAKSFVNRVWAHYLGIGLVDPVDNFSLANPPSNEKLLNALAREFIEHHYDLRHLERTILTSRVYQLSSTTTVTNHLDRRNFSHAYVRPIMAEATVDVINAALGVSDGLGKDVPPGCRAIEIGASRVQDGNTAFAFRIFGRPLRAAACDCERSLEPALPQTLYRMADQALLAKLQRSRLVGLLKNKKSNEEILDELFLATLTRLPTKAERETLLAFCQSKKQRQAALMDTFWALINTREFILNH
jgi:hypothetical protein